MDIFECITTRRSVPLVTQDKVSKELIEKILEAGTYAPNHFRTKPWRFFVLTGDARAKLGKVFQDVTKSTIENPGHPDSLAKIEKAKKNPLRAPLLIAVAVEPSQKKNVLEQEEYAAVASAVQNMLLAAHSLGLGAIWRTGNLCYEERVKEFFGLSAKGELMAFVYIGAPKKVPPKVKKPNIDEVTTWM